MCRQWETRDHCRAEPNADPRIRSKQGTPVNCSRPESDSAIVCRGACMAVVLATTRRRPRCTTGFGNGLSSPAVMLQAATGEKVRRISCACRVWKEQLLSDDLVLGDRRLVGIRDQPVSERQVVDLFNLQVLYGVNQDDAILL